MSQQTLDHLDHMFDAIGAAITNDPDTDPTAKMLGALALGIGRIVIKDIHRIADANERMVGIYEENARAYKQSLQK